MLLLFPLLFKSQKSNLPGLSELSQKLKDMGLDSFVEMKNQKQVDQTGSNDNKSDKSDSKNWYFLGP